MLHLILHLLVPLACAASFYRTRWLSAFGLMMLGMAIDIDHLLATPIYDAGRCSIGFHPLHTAVPILLYAALAVHPKTRILGIGLCIHIGLDAANCWGWP